VFVSILPALGLQPAPAKRLRSILWAWTRAKAKWLDQARLLPAAQDIKMAIFSMPVKLCFERKVIVGTTLHQRFKAIFASGSQARESV